MTRIMYSFRTSLATTMQPAMPAADLLAQLMSPPPHSTQAAIPFVPAFSPTPQQHQPAGHTLPQPMQPPCATAAFAQPFSPTQQQHQPMGHAVPQPMQAPFATSAFTQPPSFHTFSHPHITTQPYQNFSSHHHSVGHSSCTNLHHIQPAQRRHNHNRPHQLCNNIQPPQFQLHHKVIPSTAVHVLAPDARSTDPPASNADNTDAFTQHWHKSLAFGSPSLIQTSLHQHSKCLDMKMIVVSCSCCRPMCK